MSSSPAAGRGSWPRRPVRRRRTRPRAGWGRRRRVRRVRHAPHREIVDAEPRHRLPRPVRRWCFHSPEKLLRDSLPPNRALRQPPPFRPVSLPARRIAEAVVWPARQRSGNRVGEWNLQERHHARRVRRSQIRLFRVHPCPRRSRIAGADLGRSGPRRRVLPYPPLRPASRRCARRSSASPEPSRG